MRRDLRSTKRVERTRRLSDDKEPCVWRTRLMRTPDALRLTAWLRPQEDLNDLPESTQLKGGGSQMKRTELALPEIGAIAATRAMLGAGLGLLMAGRLSQEHRRMIGVSLLAIGV